MKNLIKYLVRDVPGSLNHFVGKAIDKQDIDSLKYLQEKNGIDDFIKQKIQDRDEKALKSLNQLLPEAIESFSRSQVTLINKLSQEDSRDSLEMLTKLEPLAGAKIGGDSLLKYALKENKVAAIRMVKAGFTLAEDEITPAQKKTILESNSLKQSIFGGKRYTPNDKLREAIIGSAAKEELAKIDLSKKPSPLYLAMQTGQHDLAVELISSGQVLKRYELASYAAEQGKTSKVAAYFTINVAKRSMDMVKKVPSESGK